MLDTHTFLWAIFEPERLSRAVRRWLINARMHLYLSVVSIWEMELKHRKGKLSADPSVVDANMRELSIYPLAIAVPHIRALAMLDTRGPAAGHNDPFDRLIAAQAVSRISRWLLPTRLLPDMLRSRFDGETRVVR